MFSQRTGWNLAQNRFSRALERYRVSRRVVLDLTAGNPTTIGLQYDTQGILGALHDPAALEYKPDARGLAAAREAVCSYYSGHGVKVDPGRVVLTTSTSEAYSFVLRLLCDPGDELLVPAPSYPLFDFLAGFENVRLVPYPMFYDHGWHLDLASIQRRLTRRTRGVVVVHPNNPTGSFVKPTESAKLTALCAGHGLALIADEVFLDFPHSPSARLDRSFAGNDGALTFTLSGLSKIAGLPQMKFAWIAASGPEEALTEALSRLEMVGDTYLSMSTPIQLAAPALFGTRHGFQEQLKARIAVNLRELDCGLSKQSLSSRLEIEGGWYAVLRVPAIVSDEDMAIALLEDEGVLVHPGHFYDFASEGHLVVSLIVPEEEFRQGLKRTLEWVGAKNSSL